MSFLDFDLDEDYCFRLPNGGRLEIPFYGTASIVYIDDDEWRIHSLTLSASNGKSGKDCIGWDEPILQRDPLFAAVDDYLQTTARERVEDAIRQHIKDERDSYLFDLGKERAKMKGAV